MRVYSIFLFFYCIFSNILWGDDFGKYWFSGKSEVSRYELKQQRYGRVFNGEATLIFVTEDFLTKKQVKSDYNTNEASVKILKLNKMRSFNTGFYSYSTMLSVFQPIKSNYPIKLTFSSQDWCGQVFTQVNNLGKNYNFRLNSYFQSEGDLDKKLPLVYSEDSLFCLARIAPKSLPVGKQEILPSLNFTRFKNIPSSGEGANLEFLERGDFYEYIIDYANLGRKLILNIEKNFPHKILEWREINSKYPKNPTVAILKNSEILPYWELNKNGDEAIRAKMDYNIIKYK